jgi:hypothetical protein
MAAHFAASARSPASSNSHARANALTADFDESESGGAAGILGFCMAGNSHQHAMQMQYTLQTRPSCIALQQEKYQPQHSLPAPHNAGEQHE